MTRLLCFADLHLGSGQAYSDDRLADQEAVLNQIADLAHDESVDLICLAGDVFHRPRPTPAALMVFSRFLKRLENPEIPCIAVLGNCGHDQEGIDRPAALELFASHRFRVSRRPELITEFAWVAVATLPSVPVSRLVAGSESAERGPVFAQAAEALLAVAHDLNYQASEAGYHNRSRVLVGHWSITGASLPNGLPSDSFGEPVVDFDALQAIGYQAIVLGHLHKPQRLDDQEMWGGPTTMMVYCGSPLPVDFGEEMVEHGCWILEVADNGDETADFHPLESRRFVTIDCDLTGDFRGFDETDALAAAVAARFPLTDAVVRLRYRCSEEQQRRIDLPAIKKLVADAGVHKLYQVAPEIVREDRARVAGVDENLSPQEALRAWVEANGLSEDQAARIRELMETP